MTAHQHTGPGQISLQVSANVRRIRVSLGLSQFDLAELLRANGWERARQTTISRLENADQTASVDALVALAAALDVPPMDLLLPPTTEGPTS